MNFNLERFVVAQDSIIQDAKAELRRGSKQGHWMWFIFPQIEGLGSSPMAQKFGISCRAEAEAYLAHEILGPRLKECTGLVIEIEGRSAEEIFGGIDAVKFRSSMTLFAQVAGAGSLFADALDRYFGGQPDPLTIDRL
jgi:uncharacterized protein (DUF1810 family)